MDTPLIDALKLIIARSPSAGENAVRALASARAGSPMAQTRYQQVLIQALADPQAEWTSEERMTLADAVSGAAETSTRTHMLHVRLSDAERARLERRAGDAGMSMSEYVRSLILGDA